MQKKIVMKDDIMSNEIKYTPVKESLNQKRIEEQSLI